VVRRTAEEGQSEAATSTEKLGGKYNWMIVVDEARRPP